MSSVGSVPVVDHVQVVALYDPDTGRILHLHMITTLSGAERYAEADAIAEARTRAARRHENAETLAVALSNDAQHGLHPHSIDPVTRAFVRLPDNGPGPKPSAA